jgi:hypothetical protein
MAKGQIKTFEDGGPEIEKMAEAARDAFWPSARDARCRIATAQHQPGLPVKGEAVNCGS